jgi:hypothetical protein
MEQHMAGRAPAKTRWRCFTGAAACLLIAAGISACYSDPSPKPCGAGTESYNGTCVPHVTAQYLACVKGLGFSSSNEVDAGVSLPEVAHATVQLAYKKSLREDTPVALQKVHDCLGLAEQAATSDTDRGAARKYATQVARDIKAVRPNLPAIEVAPQGALDCGTADIGTQLTCQLTIKSVGSATLSITSAEITGTDSGDFAVNDTCLGALEPAQSCVMSIQFQPSTAGDREATLVIHQNLPLPDHGTALELTGTGTGDPGPSPSPAPSPSPSPSPSI